MLSLFAALALAAPACPVNGGPLVLAHRGASAERPEQTLEAFERAIDEGADYIELDLVLSKDNVLIVRHENELSGTTNIASHAEFADRKVTKQIDGNAVTGWFTEDMTLAELRTLRARERLPELRPSSARFDGLYPVATFEEVIQLVRAKEAETGRRIGLYPEIKHAAYFASIGLPHERVLLPLLARYGYDGADDAILLHSFEVGVLESLHKNTSIRIMQIVAAGGGPVDRPGITYAEMTSPKGLKAVAHYAVGLNADAALAFPSMGKGDPTPGPLFTDAHKTGLKVHIWTIRPENQFLPKPLWNGDQPASWGNMGHVVDVLLAAGADGIVTDAPGLALSRIDRSQCGKADGRGI